MATDLADPLRPDRAHSGSRCGPRSTCTQQSPGGLIRPGLVLRSPSTRTTLARRDTVSLDRRLRHRRGGPAPRPLSVSISTVVANRHKSLLSAAFFVPCLSTWDEALTS